MLISITIQLARIQHYHLYYVSLKLFFFKSVYNMFPTDNLTNTNIDISALALRLTSVMQMQMTK